MKTQISKRICQTAGGVLALVAASLASVAGAAPDEQRPFLSSLFTDNMVLQRSAQDPVWGWTNPGQSVMVTVTGAKMKSRVAVAVAGSDGKWTVRLPELPVGGPYTLTVTAGQTVTLHNILVGDVWICSGQSNMQFGLGNANNGDKEIAAANFPNIRLFSVPDTIAYAPRQTTSGAWQECSPTSVRSQGTWNGFSAVGYFFGRELYQKTHIPIGLIESHWGGTVAQAWTSEAALKTMPDFVPALAQMETARKAGDDDQLHTTWYAKNDVGTPRHWESPDVDDRGWNTINAPVFFQDAGVAELVNKNGVVWYRRTFDVPADAVAKTSTVHLKADDDDATWINGQLIGTSEGAGIDRAYGLPANALHAGTNMIAVRVLDTGGKGGIWGDAPKLNVEFTGGPTVALAGVWKYRLGVDLAKTTPPNQSNNPNLPTVLYNGMIAPLIPFAIKGVIWYQGESNADNATQYQTLLPTMIGDWRGRWGEGNFPFLLVQLANWTPGGENWALLREAQSMTAQKTPNVGLATAIDIGDANDIHPKNKQEVGRRLALVAEAQVYHDKVEYSGPLYQAMTFDGRKIRLTFTHLGGGLAAKDGKPLTAFAIAGADGKYSPADAVIDGDSVIVSSPQVTLPTSVRYGWEANPPMSLYNKAGLPALPFRTDGP